MQAAEALDHAHQLGVVHRDVKPANLLVDGRGSLWVTDFGLAQVQQSEASLTRTGDLVGTLRYMSPEQALAKRVVIDHRTDVYSLGATLYELLTLRPAFGGNDRQELLRQIAFDEPLSPRRLNRAVAAELEVVVLKALEKNPAERYVTAQELADDLRRWLDDRPIQARRPSLLQRARKWARRHQPAVRTGVALLVLAAILCGGAGAWWLQKRAGAQADARAALAEAGRYQEQERWSEGLSAARRAQGVLAGLWADAALSRGADDLARDMEMAQRLEEARLKATASGGGRFDWETTNDAYGEAFQWYGLDVEHLDPQEAGERIRSRSIRQQLAMAVDDWALNRRALKVAGWERLVAATRVADPDLWRNRLRDAMAGKDPRAVEEFAASDPGEQSPLATAELFFALADRTPAAERAAVFLREARRRHPEDFWLNYQLAFCLGTLRRPQLEEAIHYATAAAALRPQSSGVRTTLAGLLLRRGQPEEAIAECHEALHLYPDDWGAHSNLGVALKAKGRLDEALNEFREAVRLARKSPAAHYNLGHLLADKGQMDEATREYREAVRLKKDYPEAHYHLAVALGDQGQLADAIAEFQEAIRLKKDYLQAHCDLGLYLTRSHRLDDAVAELRKAVQLRKDFAPAHNDLGIAFKEKGLFDEAINEFREAIRIQKDYAEAHCNLGNLLRRRGQFRGAAEELRLGHEIGSRNPRWPYPSAEWLRETERLADLDARLPRLLRGEARPADAEECLALARLCLDPKQLYAASARWYGEAFAARPDLPGDLRSGHRYDAACAAALAGRGEGKDADHLDDKERARLRNQSLAWLRAELDAWRRVLDRQPDKARAVARQKIQQWLSDTDFNGVRGPDALAKLPAAEREPWRQLWADIAETVARAQGRAGTESQPASK